VECTYDSPCRPASVDLDAKSFVNEFVDDVERAEPTACPHRIGHVVASLSCWVGQQLPRADWCMLKAVLRQGQWQVTVHAPEFGLVPELA
jgi:hypothetical protein